MSGDENKRGRNTRSSVKCDKCNRYFLNKEAVDSHKTQFHVTKKVATNTKNTPAKTSSNDLKPSEPITRGIKLTKVNSPVPENVSKIAKSLIAASKNALAKQNSSLESSINSSTTKNETKNDESKNCAPLNGKALKEDEIISELSSSSAPEGTKPPLKRRPVPVSFKNIGFKCPKCAHHFSSYFVALKHIEKLHCSSKGRVDMKLLEKLKPIRMGECVQCNEYFSLSTNHTCALKQVKPVTKNVLTNMLTNEVTISSMNNAINTYTNPKKSNKNEVFNPQLASDNRFKDDVETSVDPIALSEEDEVDPTKLMYVKRNSEFKCLGCHRTFINFDGFNSHVIQYHYDEAEIFFVNSTQEFNQLSTLIKNQSGANYKMLEMSSQTPGYFFLQCQSRPLIDKSGIAYYCPSSLILEKFGHVHLVAYCKKHYCPTKGLIEVDNAESLLKKNKTDLYLQFKQITESIIIEAAKVKVSKLTELNEKAKEFAKYLHKINIKDEPVQNIFHNTIQYHPGLNLDEITEYKEDVKPRKRRVTYNDELKPSTVKRKKTSNLSDHRDQSPVHETITTNVIIENHSPKIMNTFKKDSPTISVKSVESLNSLVADKFTELKKDVPASFSDTYKHFLESSSDMFPAQDKTKIRTKLGQFSPKNKVVTEGTVSKKKKKSKIEKSESETDSKSNKKVTFSPKIASVQTLNPKFVAKKSIALATKTNDLSPKSSVSPKQSILVNKSKPPAVVASPKISVKYEVKEQENDCNILILKI